MEKLAIPGIVVAVILVVVVGGGVWGWAKALARRHRDPKSAE